MITAVESQDRHVAIAMAWLGLFSAALMFAGLFWSLSRSRTKAEVIARSMTAEAAAANYRNELLLNSVGEGIYALDLDGRTTLANPAAARMLGYAADEIVGRSQHDVIHHTKPDGSPYPRVECPIYAAFADGQVHHVDSEVF